MSRPFVDKLWNASPASLLRAAQRRLTAKNQPAWFKVQGGPLQGAQLLLPDTTGAWGEMIAGTFDSFIYEGIAANGGLNGKTVWDVGAHFGYHSQGFTALGAEVVAFEPNKANQSILEQNLARNVNFAKRIKRLPIALSNEDGTTTFIASDSIEGSSSGSHLATAQTPYSEETVSQFQRVTVSVARADSLIREQKVSAPDVMKIDVEGAEALVLEGAQELLASKKPNLYIEVHHICVMCDLRALLARFNYSVKIIDAEHATPSRCFISAV